VFFYTIFTLRVTFTIKPTVNTTNMRVLIVSKFFYPRGGACVVAMGTRELLLESGHNVRVFAMSYPKNIDLPESSTFASQIDFNSNLLGKIKAFQRLIGIGDVVQSFKKVIEDFRPDIVHMHNIHSYLSPVVGEIAHKTGARVVWTLHDFKLICPAYSFRKGNGDICNCCTTSECHIIKNKCLKNNYIHSLMAYIEARTWSRPRLDRNTDIFIAPSKFMSNMMIRGGFNPSKLHVLYNFIDPAKLKILYETGTTDNVESHFFAYTGRLSEEKGVKTLIKAAILAGVSLKIAGDGPLRRELEEIANGHPEIIFLGKLQAEDVARLQHETKACICPSEWFENNPLAVIESLCAGTPVIGANIGGIPELIEPGVNGQLYPSGDVDALCRLLKNFNSQDYDSKAITENATQKFSRELHLKRLLKLYETALSQTPS